MLKKITFKNWYCFNEEQEINIYDNSEDSFKNINLIFGIPSSGKTAIFQLIKHTISYMKRWISFKDDHILSNETMAQVFNPNINNDCVDEHQNFTEVSLEFDNNTFSYKYDLSFNQHYCLYEKLSYKINDVLDEWILLFDKQLIDYVDISNKIETIYETYVNCEELEVDYQPTFKGVDQRDTVISYISNISKAEHFKVLNKMLDKIIFYEEKDFLNFKDYFLPFEELRKQKESVLELFEKNNVVFNDFDLGSLNKMTGKYTLNFFSYDETTGKSKILNSSKFSKGEIKLLIYLVLYNQLKKENKIVFIDDFSLALSYENFFEILKSLEESVKQENGNFQLFLINNHFYNKVVDYNSQYINVFDVKKDELGNSEVNKKI